MSELNSITCPSCHHAFTLNDAIAEPMVARLREKYESEAAQRRQSLVAREKQLEEQAKAIEQSKAAIDGQVAAKLENERKRIATEQEKKAKEAVDLELRNLQQQVQEQSNRIAQAQEQQLAIMKEKRALDQQRADFELEKIKQIDLERQKIRDEAKKAALETVAAQVIELKEMVALKDKKLSEAHDAELVLRKQKLEFDEQKKSFELDMARRSEEIALAVKKEKDEEFRLKEAEKNKQMADLNRQIDELKRKAEQGSQQTQGEVLELDLEEALRRCFSDDEIVPVPKGIQGGDALQHVKDEMGHHCGTVIWESKRTKAWSDGWLAKLKDDRQVAKAQLAILVSVTMPKDVPAFECRENVWITPPHLAVPVAAALRLSLIEAAAAKRAIEGRQDKITAVYDYLSGSEFKNRVVTIVEAFSTMQADLEAEKKAIQKLWAKREKQLERVIANTAGLHGDLAGIIGKALPIIDQLELAALTDHHENGDAVTAVSDS